MGIEVNHRDITDGMKDRSGGHSTGFFPKPGKDHSRKEGRKMPPLKQYDGVTKGEK